MSAPANAPFVYDREQDQILTMPCVGAPSGFVVAGMGWGGPDGDRHACAHLFTIAPELAAALQNAVVALAMCVPQTGYGAGRQREALLEGNALLAKLKAGQ